MRLQMRIIGIILLFALCIPIWSQTLTIKQIEGIQANLKNLPDESVFPEEVVVIETNFGNITIELFYSYAPLHSMNFKKLTKAGYFSGTTFHRVIPGFVIQGGDILSRDTNPTNDGTGGPGYTLPPEFGQKHLRGCVASARKGDNVNPEKRSNGSQFYICMSDLPNLNKMGYTVFGRVIKGMDVADRISKVARDKRDRPKKDIIMKSVYIADKSKMKLKRKQ